MSFCPDRFVADLRAAAADAHPVRAVNAVMKEAVADPAAVAAGVPDYEGDELALLETDGLSVYCARFFAEQLVPPHNHRIPAFIGVYEGTEINQLFRHDAPASPWSRRSTSGREKPSPSAARASTASTPRTARTALPCTSTSARSRPSRALSFTLTAVRRCPSPTRTTRPCCDASSDPGERPRHRIARVPPERRGRHASSSPRSRKVEESLSSSWSVNRDPLQPS